MASTSYKNTGAVLTLAGLTFGFEGRVNYSVTRSNNTLSFTGVTAQIRYTGGGSSFTYGTGWDTRAQVPSGTNRSSGFWSGTRSVGTTNTTGSQSFSVGVGADTTSINVRVGGRFRNDGYTYTSNTSISVPALGSPSGTTTVDASQTTNSRISVRNNTTSWGANATSGSVRSYRADNSSWSGQTYISTTDNVLVAHDGLVANKRYWFRGWSSNGGGKSAYHSTTQAVTKSIVTSSSPVEALATTATFNAIRVTQGEYTTSTKIQYRKKGDATWLDSEVKTGDNISITLSGLSPSTTYERRFTVTTTAGTTDNAIFEFTTLPAGKLIYPDGTVKNAIPRLVRSDGTVEMVNVNMIQ